MIPIVKTKEPNSWTLHRLTPGAKYEATPDLRHSLLTDQGFICAYCMRRIEDDGSATRIEHVTPQSALASEAERMDYSNMVICCAGDIEGEQHDRTHCDRHKGNDLIHFSPLDNYASSTIRYKSDGTIESSDIAIDKNLNTVLNLNVSTLKLNRKSVKDGLVRQLGKKEWKKADLEKILVKYTSKDKDGKFIPYCGVVIHYIQKKLRNLK
ncbi:MAG: TIGR02646 family protein [Muribaculum sp.]|nr:TIGR02646 family protein [Muribaculum sp.]